MLAGEILLKQLNEQIKHARSFEEYMHIEKCIIATEEALMWQKKALIEQEAQIECEIRSMLQETKVA